MATLTLANARAALAPAPTETAIAVGIKPGFGSAASFDLLQRQARMFNMSSLVPPQFQGPANFANAVIAMEIAGRMGASALQVMQELYIVQGRPCFSAKFLIATFNQCGRFSAIRYEFSGREGTDDWGCRAVATELATGTELVGTNVTIGLAKAEGWLKKQGSKWLSMPGQMLRYRAASWFIRAYAPEISMGIRTVEEERDSVTIDYDEVVAAHEKTDLPEKASQPPSEPRQPAAPSPTPGKARGGRRARLRALNGEIQDAAPVQEAPAPEPEAPAEPDPTPDEIEQTFLRMCDKAGALAGEVLSAYDDMYGEAEPDDAMAAIVASPDVWNAVRRALQGD